VKEYISTCNQCCYYKSKGDKPEKCMHYNDTDPVPFRRLYIDHLGPFVRSKRGNTHILTISDPFRKYLIVKAVKNTKTLPVLNILN